MAGSDDFKAGDDKFPELSFEKLPQQLQWKLYRAKQHFKEFEREVAAYMNVPPNGPGKIMHSPSSTPENPMFMYGSDKPLPARFGLIAGDFLQNLRSCLDYLVWQLALSNRAVPSKRDSAFPVCKSEDSWRKCYKRKLCGVPENAAKIIESLQPYTARQMGNSPQPMEILDELTNENKHRQVLMTVLGSRLEGELPAGIPSIAIQVMRDGIPGETLSIYLAFEGGIAKGLEVTAVLQGLMDWMGYRVLPLFEKFF